MVSHTNTARTDCEHYVEIGQIRLNTKKLRKLSAAKIRRYAILMEAGCEFPPISVVDCGGFYTIRDGRHRYCANLANGNRFIAVTVV